MVFYLKDEFFIYLGLIIVMIIYCLIKNELEMMIFVSSLVEIICNLINYVYFNFLGNGKRDIYDY